MNYDLTTAIKKTWPGRSNFYLAAAVKRWPGVSRNKIIAWRQPYQNHDMATKKSAMIKKIAIIYPIRP